MSRFEENIFGLVAKKDLLQIGYDVTRPNDPVDQLIDDDGPNGTNYDLPHGSYIPVQVGYDYIFDCGFILGASFEGHISFNRVTNTLNETNVQAAFGFAGGGIHLGYHF